MTKAEFVKTMREFHENYFSDKYRKTEPKTYKYKGVIKTRDTYKLTEEGERLSAIEEASEYRFICPDCGREVEFGALETWLGETDEQFLNNKVPCSLCYEEAMGEDL